MPLLHRTNNRIVPANSRAVDVAKRSIKDIIPVQQRRYANAFEVQGYETIVYQRLWHGVACSCQNHRGVSASYLDRDGKMAPGAMDTLLSGGLPFAVNRYAARQPIRPDMRSVPSKFEDGQIMDGDDVGDNSFTIADDELNDVFATDISSEHQEGTNGPSDAEDLDDRSTIFDGESDMNDTRCAICFGSGYVGGYAVLNGYRKVLHTNSPELTVLNGTKEYNKVPHAFMCSAVEFRTVLPKGAMSVDQFAVWNNDKMVWPDSIQIDGLPFSNALLLALCDGREHTLSLGFDDELTYFTHVEIQLNLSRIKALFELPRMSQGTNEGLQDATNELSLNASPAIPALKKGDILVECTFGKALIVGSCNPWNDAQRNVLGWDVDTRVIQPSELVNLLPRRQLTDQKSTYMVRDNMSGIRRT